MKNKIIPIVTQNVDRVIRRRDYEDLGDQLLVTSVFRTIQGEGPYAGYPAVFLRLAGCNFGDKEDHCSWCDTSFQFDKGQKYTGHELMYELTSQRGYASTDILVITGGEPTLQPALVPFLAAIGPQFKRVQIETNGTQAAFFKELERIEDEVGGEVSEDFRYVRPSIVVSPKASAKAGRIPEPADVVKRYASCFKFVISSDPNDPQHRIPEWAFHLGIPVYVSPMAVYKRPYAGEVSSVWDPKLINQEATAANYAYAAKYAMDNHLLLSLQTHLFTAIP